MAASLVGLLAALSPARADTVDTLPVITLAEQAPGDNRPERRLRWRCDSLLRADFSLHSPRSCRPNGQESGGRELQTRLVSED